MIFFSETEFIINYALFLVFAKEIYNINLQINTSIYL